MRDPERIKESLDCMRAAWNTFPDLRLCQLILNVVHKEGLSKEDQLRRLFYMEDDEFIFLLGGYCAGGFKDAKVTGEA